MGSATQMVSDVDFVGIDMFPISVVDSGEIRHLSEHTECENHADSVLQGEEAYENDFSAIEQNCVNTLKITPSDHDTGEYEIEAISNVGRFEEFIPTDLADDFESTRHYCNDNFFHQESNTVFRTEGLTRMYNLDTIYENLQENLDITPTEVQRDPNPEIRNVSYCHDHLNVEYLEDQVTNSCISQGYFSHDFGGEENLTEQSAPISPLQNLLHFCEGNAKIETCESSMDAQLNALCTSNELIVSEDMLNVNPGFSNALAVAGLREQITSLTSQNDILVSERNQIEDENIFLKQELQEIKIKYREANSQQSERDDRIAELKQEIVQLGRHIKNLNDQLKTASDKNLEHSSKIAQTEAINANLREKLEEHVQDMANRQKTETELHETLQENANLKAAIDRYELSLQKVEKDKIMEIEKFHEKVRLKESTWTEERSNLQKILTEESGKRLELQNKINVLEGEKDQLLKTTSLLSTENSKQEDKLKEFSERIEQLECVNQECKTLREENHTLKEETSHFQDEVEKLLLLDNKNNAKIFILKDENQLLQDRLKFLENEKLALEKTNLDVSESLKRQMLKVKKTRNMFKKYIQFLNADRVSMVRKYKRTRNRYHSLRSDLNCYKSLVEEMEREILTQKGEIDRANNTITHHQLTEADLNKKMNHFQETICNLRENHRLAVNEMNFFNSEMSIAREKIEQVNQEKLKLEIILKDRDSYISKLQNDTACLTDTLQIYNVRQRNLETSFESLKEDLIQVHVGFSKAQKELEHLESKVYEVESLSSNLELEKNRLKAERNSTVAIYEKKLEEAATKFVNISNELRYQHQLLAEYRQENNCLKDTLHAKKKKFFTLERRTITSEQDEKTNNSPDNQLKPTNILSSFFSKIFHTNRKYKVNEMSPPEPKDTVSLTAPSERISKKLSFN